MKKAKIVEEADTFSIEQSEMLEQFSSPMGSVHMDVNQKMFELDKKTRKLNKTNKRQFMVVRKTSPQLITSDDPY